MATLDPSFDELFEDYYTLYRAEATVPVSTDDEYAIALVLSREAVNYWENFDGTLWKELYDTNQNDGSGAQTITTSTTAYAAPTNFKDAGGFIKVKDSNGNTIERYPIIEPQEAQFKDDNGQYAYFTKSPLYYSTGTASQSTTTITGVGTTWTAAMVGMQFLFVTGESVTITAFVSTTSLTASVSQTVTSSAYRILTTGFTLNINPAPTANLNGKDIDYVYYKKPTKMTAGASHTEMSNPFFIVHRMLANRFRASRNPYTNSAKNDAENAVKVMQIKNNSGNWADPPTLSDTSGTTFGS